jgi:hypothetical protein
MLTGGFYAEVTITYDAAIAQENKGRPFGIESIRGIQLSKRNVLDVLEPIPVRLFPLSNGYHSFCVLLDSNHLCLPQDNETPFFSGWSLS